MLSLFRYLRPTPHSNTGSNRQKSRGIGFHPEVDRFKSAKCTKIEAHLDYLTVCGSQLNLSSLEANVWAVFGTRFDWQGARPGTVGKFYELNALTPNGLMLSLNTDSSGQVIDYRLCLSGKLLGHSTRTNLHKFGKYLLSIGARCSRFDWAIDDFNRTLDIDIIRSECELGNRHGFIEYAYYESGKKGQKHLGKTIYLGAFDTEFLARIYDKNVESKGEIDAIRWEAQTRGDIAHSFFCQYFGCDDLDFITVEMSKRAIGKFRFVYQVSDCLKRCPNLIWWDRFVRLVGGQVKISVPRFQPMLSDKKRWIESQVTGTLSLIFKCMGVEKGANWLLEEIKKKSEEKEFYNQRYYDTWKDRRKCDSEDYDFRVSRFIEDREYDGVCRRISSICSETISAVPSVLFLYRLAVCMARIFSSRLLGQLFVFPEVHQMVLF